MQFSIRDSRFGLLVRAPEKYGIRASALMELDFFGQIASNATETQNWSTAMAPRLRHFYFRIDNPVLDILVGQYWHLFGWQNVYHPSSVQAQGLLGEGKEEVPDFVRERFGDRCNRGLGSLAGDLWELGGEFREYLKSLKL